MAAAPYSTYILIRGTRRKSGRGARKRRPNTKLHRQGMQPQIPPRKNRKAQREYDKHLYRQRHLVENAFLHIKQWRGIATRYAKNLASFLAAAQIRCLVLWLKIS